MSVFKKTFGIFMAMNGVGCGVAVFLQSGLGSDPIGLLCDGIRHSLSIQFGNASLIYNVLVILLALLIAKGSIGAGTIAYAIFSGYFIDFYNWMLEPLQFDEKSLYIRVLIYLIGEFLFAKALALLIQFHLGMNALDALLYKGEAVTKIPYAVLRIGCDALYTLFGFLLGGTCGMGTLISVLLTGTLIGQFTKTAEKC